MVQTPTRGLRDEGWTEQTQIYQLIAAIATILEFQGSHAEFANVDSVAERYRANLRVASGPLDPSKLTVENLDAAVLEATKEKP